MHCPPPLTVCESHSSATFTARSSARTTPGCTLLWSGAAPDLIFLTGDLVDEYAEEPVSYARTVGAALSAIAPTYFVTGNHEWAQGNAVAEAVKTALSESGVTVLSNEFVPLEQDGQTIFIAGIDDPNGYADQLTPAELAQRLYTQYADPFWLLLAHRNNLFNGRYCRLGADLTFSGHAHGGIWAPALYGRAAGHEPELVPLLHQRLLPLYGRGLRGRGGVCLPGTRQFSQMGASPV